MGFISRLATTSPSPSSYAPRTTLVLHVLANAMSNFPRYTTAERLRRFHTSPYTAPSTSVPSAQPPDVTPHRGLEVTAASHHHDRENLNQTDKKKKTLSVSLRNMHTRVYGKKDARVWSSPSPSSPTRVSRDLPLLDPSSRLLLDPASSSLHIFISLSISSPIISHRTR